jgi:ketosteroid isomerase-like protein
MAAVGAAMYHAIVRRKVLSLFDAINRGDARPVIDGFAGQFEHIFLGQTALGGRRTSRAAITAWYARLYRLLPDIHFTVERITVSSRWPSGQRRTRGPTEYARARKAFTPCTSRGGR